MTPKSVGLLAVVTAVAIAGAAAALNIERGYMPQSAEGLLYPGLLEKIDTVTKIAVDHKDGALTLVREKNGTWSAPDSDGYAANQAQAQKIILEMANLKLFEAKTAKPELYGRLHLEDIKRRAPRRVVCSCSTPPERASP